MGFDLYGKNPENPKGLSAPTIDWTRSNIPEDEKKKYFNAVDAFHNKVKGDYFRANVWWWRPIWDFTCWKCGDILNDKDIRYGSSNDNHFINKSKSKRIATRLNKAIQNGSAQKYEDQVTALVKRAKKKNNAIDKKLDKLKKEVEKATGTNKLAPSEYPKSFKEKWDVIYAGRDWGASYPFNTKYLKEFSDFCNESGGFYIG
jgi:hypothetical protein